MNRRPQPRRKVHSRKSAFRSARIIALSVCIAMLCIGGFLLGKYLLRTNQTMQISEQLEDIYESASDAADAPSNEAVSQSTETDEPSGYQYIGDALLPESQALYDLNPDYIGWVRIPNVLKQPVVYRDNTYYLDHDFYGSFSDAGTAFLNSEHPFSEFSQYLFIHGHSMHDGTMFGRLLQYRKQKYFAENPYLYFTTLYREEIYEIFAVTEVPESQMYSELRLGAPTFSGKAEFTSFIDSLRRSAIHFSDSPISPDSAILALSTCHDDQRVTVFFKRIDPMP